MNDLLNQETTLLQIVESTETIEDSQFSTKTSISADKASTECVKYIWGKYKDHEFEKNLPQVYETVVFWKKNLFLLPSGEAGRKFIGEASRHWNN